MTSEERKIRAQFRENRVKRKEINKILVEARERKRILVQERDEITGKANAIGIQLGKKVATA